MHGPISATISGAGDVNNQASTPELVPAFFHGSISRDGSLKYMVLSLPPFLELVVRKASTPELIHAFSTVPSLEMHGPMHGPPFLEIVTQTTTNQIRSSSRL